MPPLLDDGAFGLSEGDGSSFSLCISSLPILGPLTVSDGVLYTVTTIAALEPFNIYNNLLITKPVALSVDEITVILEELPRPL